MCDAYAVVCMRSCRLHACSLRNGLIIDALADFSPVCRTFPTVLTEMGDTRPTTLRAVLDTPTRACSVLGESDVSYHGR